MKRLLFISILMSLLVILTNALTDPAGVFRLSAIYERSVDERKIAEIIASGDHAIIPDEKIGFDERQSRVFLIENKQQNIQSMVFGSSRARYLSQKAFPKRRHFVDAVNAATLEDLLIFTFLREKNLSLPKKNLYIALDPWMIAESNDYADWLTISVPGVFVSAVEHFGFPLPIKSQKRYGNMAHRHSFRLPLDETEYFLDSSISNGLESFQKVASARMPFSNDLPISFDASITEGQFNWAWRIRVNGKLVDKGTYMDVMRTNIAPHEMRTFVTKEIKLKQNDHISLEMAHAGNKGNIVPKGLQHYSAKKLTLLMKCSDPRAKNQRLIRRLVCYFPKRQHLKSVYLIGRELISPAYFQHSLKKIFLKYVPEETESLKIRPKHGSCEQKLSTILAGGAQYLLCNDGSFPWPPKGSIDSKAVINIVKTVDDGLVPFNVLDENALSLLGKLTDFFQNRDIQVKYLLLPVHPYSFEKWKAENDSRGFIKAEKIYKVFAAKRNIPLFGSYDPKAMGCTGDDFRDWVHPLPSCSNRVASAAQEEL